MQDTDELEALGAFWRRMKQTEDADVAFLMHQLITAPDREAKEAAIRSYRKQMLQVGHSEGWVAAR